MGLANLFMVVVRFFLQATRPSSLSSRTTIYQFFFFASGPNPAKLTRLMVLHDGRARFLSRVGNPRVACGGLDFFLFFIFFKMLNTGSTPDCNNGKHSNYEATLAVLSLPTTFPLAPVSQSAGHLWEVATCGARWRAKVKGVRRPPRSSSTEADRSWGKKSAGPPGST